MSGMPEDWETAVFIAIPIRLRDCREFATIPLANGVLIVLNVLAFCAGWQPFIGPGTGLLSMLTYAFGHAGVWHLAGNMLTLLVFGTAVNRRMGNLWYLSAYLGSAVALGFFAWMFAARPLIGASGAIFSVIAMTCLLLPAARVEVGYFALFPVTLLVGIVHRPEDWVRWFIRWDNFEVRAWWGLVLVPVLEFWGLFWVGWNWTNLAHLFGLVCGVTAVLLLPTRISMPGRIATFATDR